MLADLLDTSHRTKSLLDRMIPMPSTTLSCLMPGARSRNGLVDEVAPKRFFLFVSQCGRVNRMMFRRRKRNKIRRIVVVLIEVFVMDVVPLRNFASVCLFPHVDVKRRMLPAFSPVPFRRIPITRLPLFFHKANAINDNNPIRNIYRLKPHLSPFQKNIPTTRGDTPSLSWFLPSG